MDSYLSIYMRIKIYEFLDENNNFIKKTLYFLKFLYTKIKTPLINFFDGGSPY